MRERRSPRIIESSVVSAMAAEVTWVTMRAMRAIALVSNMLTDWVVVDWSHGVKFGVEEETNFPYEEDDVI